MLRGSATDSPSPGTKRVAVTGAAGNVSYSTLFYIASGGIFGPTTPIELSLIEIPGKPFKALQGVAMELEDCAFPLLRSIYTSDKPRIGFHDADAAILVGGAPHVQGMVRADLLHSNAPIFVEQGRALNDVAKPDVQALIVANPANTNALIASEHAPDLHPEQFMALSRLDQNRAVSYLASKTHTSMSDIEQVVVWGNHSTSMYPDLSNALVAGKPALSVVNDPTWVRSKFMPKVQNRAEDLISVRGKSSAASAAKSAVDHLRDLFQGSDTWQTMAVPSDGSFGIDEGLWFSVPCKCANGGYYRVQDIPPMDEFSRSMLDKNKKELITEAALAREFVPSC